MNLPPLATSESVLVSCPICKGTGTDQEEHDDCGFCAGTGLAVDDAVTQALTKKEA